MLFDIGLPPKFAKLSKILWKIGKFWKKISADQIHSSGDGKSALGWRNCTLIGHERASVHFLVLPGSLLSLTEITESTYVSLI